MLATRQRWSELGEASHYPAGKRKQRKQLKLLESTFLNRVRIITSKRLVIADTSIKVRWVQPGN